MQKGLKGQICRIEMKILGKSIVKGHYKHIGMCLLHRLQHLLIGNEYDCESIQIRSRASEGTDHFHYNSQPLLWKNCLKIDVWKDHIS